MVVGIDVDTTSLDRFIKHLQDTTDSFVRQRQREMTNSMTEDLVQSMQYPATTEANAPPPYPFYQRSRGTISRTGTVLYESGDLKSNWKRETSESGNTITGRVSNTTIGRHVGGGGTRSYSSYVHGIPQHPSISLRQALFHEQRKWPSLFLNAQAIAGENVQVQAVNPSDSPDQWAEDVANEVNRF